MPFVTKLDLRFVHCVAAPIKALFNSVHFPNVDDMHLKIRSTEEGGKVDMHFHDIFHAIFPSAGRFPKLTSMELDIDTFGIWDEDEKKYTKGKISLPFAMAPKLRDLVLTTNYTEVDLVSFGIAQPAIRTLALRDCYEMKKDWIIGFLKQMKTQGNIGLLHISIGGHSESNKCGLWGHLSKEDIETLYSIEGDC